MRAYSTHDDMKTRIISLLDSFSVGMGRGHLASFTDIPCYWASEASPTLGCSIEISLDIYIYMLSVCLVCQINCVGGIT